MLKPNTNIDPFKEDSNMKKVKNQIKNEELKEFLENSEKIKNITKAETKISKQEFEIYILPFILGEVERNEANINIFIENLKDLAGGYRRELVVLDDDNKTELFRLPPLIADSDIENLKDKKLRNTIIAHKEIAESNPIAADKKLRSLANIILKGLNPSHEDIEKLHSELNKIYNYYQNRIGDKHISDQADSKDEEDYLDELGF